MSSASIFICYRRKTNAAVAGRLHDNLARHFGADEVFLDVDTIAPGRDFVEELDERVSKCTILLVVIGPNWLALEDDNGEPRLFDPEDYVHIEVKGALKRGIQVVPILVDGATLPTEDELPPDLKALNRRQAVELSHDRFVSEVDTLASSLKEFLIEREPQKLKLYELLFSLSGRIGRLEYWKAIIIFYASAIFVGLLSSFVVVAIFYGETNNIIDSFSKFESLDLHNHPGIRALIIFVSVPLFWVYFSIISKRLHDLNFGFKSIFAIFIYSFIMLIVFAFGLISEDYFTNATYVSYAFSAVLGLFPGTEGPNEYGPDPLGNRRTASWAAGRG